MVPTVRRIKSVAAPPITSYTIFVRQNTMHNYTIPDILSSKEQLIYWKLRGWTCRPYPGIHNEKGSNQLRQPASTPTVPRPDKSVWKFSHEKRIKTSEWGRLAKYCHRSICLHQTRVVITWVVRSNRLTSQNRDGGQLESYRHKGMLRQTEASSVAQTCVFNAMHI